jgi:hypothetical protein
MRRFYSYGPIDKDEHYYAPRKQLIETSLGKLLGDNPRKGGHCITVWAPRQCGKTWLFKNVPRRSDQRVYEAIFHFNLYAYIDEFLRSRSGRVFPEFPTGNGKIDLLIRYQHKEYGIELKSFTDLTGFKNALIQATKYGLQIGLEKVFLVTFTEFLDESFIQTYGTAHQEAGASVQVKPIFIQTDSV